MNKCYGLLSILGLALLLVPHIVVADTPITLLESYAGNVSYVGTQKTIRTQPNTSNPCSITSASTSAALSGIPASSTILKAYLYWSGSGSTPDYTVTFEGGAVTAGRQYTSVASGYNFFNGVADVTSAVTTKRNGSYSFSGLSVDAGSTFCNGEAVLGGWALLVIYSDASETFSVLNLYEGFQYYQFSSITLNVGNFQIPTPIGSSTGKHGHITWEGDPTLSGGGENLTFNGTALTDAINLSGNQFNSASNINNDSNSYGVDFDAYTLSSPVIQAGQTTASTVYSSGQDLVLLSAEIIVVPNTPVADLATTMAFSGTMARGQTVTYTINVTNNGPSAETGPITVTNTPSAGLTYTGASGTGWVCNAPYTTCTRTGSLDSGGSAGTITLTATVAANATGTLTNTATVDGALFDNVAGNNTATSSQALQAADLSLAISRSAALVPGSNAAYILTVSNTGSLSESAGAITVTDTLPSGLSFSSATGTNWTCSSAVVCTYNGGLAGGATAPAITLTVAVAANASGTITNSATVAGGQYDSNATNNTVEDSYTLASQGAFCETFESGLGNWTIDNSGGGDASIDTTYFESGTQGMRLRWDTVSATSGAHDISSLSGTITYWVKRGLDAANSDPPDDNEDLVIEYYNSSGVWVQLDTYAGGGTDGQVYNGSHTLPANAKHAAFKLRLRMTQGSGSDRDRDYWHVDNVCANASAPPPTAYAWYKFDETSWNGTANEVKDAVGSPAHNGTAQGGVSTSNETSTFGHDCRGAVIPAAAGSGVSTGIDVNNDIGNSGTIAFWYKSNTVWNDGNDRMLFDASNSAGTDKHFYLVKGDGGELRFALEDDSDDNENISSGGNSFPAGEWHHIAVTWDWATSDRIYLYLDGVEEDNTGINDNIGNYSTLLVGLAQTGITGTATDYTTNSANGVIDEVYVYNSALTATQISSVMSASHSCSAGIDHYELSLPSAGVSCLPITATVTACTNSASPCANAATTLSGQTATLSSSDGSLASSTVTFDASGIASTTLSYPGATNGAVVTVTLSGETTVATNSRQCCLDGSSCSVTNSCDGSFSVAGFVFANAVNSAVATIPAQVADTPSSTYYLRAVKTNTTTKACESALTGSNVSVNFAYECNNPTTCSSSDLMSINGGISTPIARNDNGSVSNYSAVNMTFDGNGNAPFTFNYGDVGQVRFHTSKAASGALLTALTGASNAFVVAPDHFGISGVTAGPIKAGSNFSATVTALGSTGAPTPNFGKETSPEGVTLSFSKCQPTGAGAVNGSFSGATGTFSGGAATGANLTWSEVGNIDLTAALASGSYLGSGLTAIGNTGTGGTVCNGAGNVGRFIPDHFDTLVKYDTATKVFMPCPSGLTCPASGDLVYGNGFVYSGQPFTTQVTALNLAGTKTSNYDSVLGYSKAVTLSLYDVVGGSTANPGGGLLSFNIVPSTAFNLGVATASTPIYTFPTTPVGPTDIYIRAVDTDNVTSLRGASSVEGGVKVVGGRVNIPNAYGSELIDLPMTATVQYYDGTSWLTSDTDSVTSLTLGLSNYQSQTGGAWTTVLSPASSQITAGALSFNLSKPTGGGTGSVDVSISVPDYFLTGSNVALVNPSNTARATFGIYKGNSKFIYIREVY